MTRLARPGDGVVITSNAQAHSGTLPADEPLNVTITLANSPKKGSAEAASLEKVDVAVIANESPLSKLKVPDGFPHPFGCSLLNDID